MIKRLITNDYSGINFLLLCGVLIAYIVFQFGWLINTYKANVDLAALVLFFNKHGNIK